MRTCLSLLVAVLVSTTVHAASESPWGSGAAKLAAEMKGPTRGLRPLDAPPAERAVRLTPLVLAKSCPKRLLNSASHPFAESAVACDAFLASALVSLALDDPRQTQRAAAAVGKLIEQALDAASQRPFASTGWSRVGGRKLPRSVLYRGFLMVMLAGHEKLASGGPYAALARELAGALARDLSSAPAGLLPSFGKAIWPCDHAPAASGLAVYAAAADDGEAARAATRLIERLGEMLERPTGFPARVDARGAALEPTPRGTVLAFASGWLAIGEPELARRFAGTLTEGFCDRLPVGAACREWPRGVSRGADAASGPLVAGYGVRAGALALAAAHGASMPEWEKALLATARGLELDATISDLGRYPLENAIFLWARTVRSWR